MNAAFLAMAHFRLGEIDKARAELKALRNIDRASFSYSRAQFESNLHEAEALILPPDRHPGK